MNKFNNFILSSLLFIGFNVAHANMAYYTRTYFIQIHFGKYFEGESVKSVMAHLGVKKGEKWFDVQDVYLNDEYKSFTSATALVDRFSSTDPVQALMISYHIILDSGRIVWTTEQKILANDLSYGNFYEGSEEQMRKRDEVAAKIMMGAKIMNRFVDQITQTRADYITTYH
jgi:hypothetical protein